MSKFPTIPEFTLLLLLPVWSLGQPIEIDISTRPTYQQLQDQGTELVPPKVVTIHAPRPIHEKQGIYFETTNTSFRLKLSPTSSIRLENAKLTVHFAWDQLYRPSLDKAPEIKTNSLAGNLWISLVVLHPGQVEDTIIPWIASLGTSTEDVSAWVKHEMWKTTGGFWKHYDAGKGRALDFSLYINDATKMLGSTIVLNWDYYYPPNSLMPGPAGPRSRLSPMK